MCSCYHRLTHNHHYSCRPLYCWNPHKNRSCCRVYRSSRRCSPFHHSDCAFLDGSYCNPHLYRNYHRVFLYRSSGRCSHFCHGNFDFLNGSYCGVSFRYCIFFEGLQLVFPLTIFLSPSKQYVFLFHHFRYLFSRVLLVFLLYWHVNDWYQKTLFLHI